MWEKLYSSKCQYILGRTDHIGWSLFLFFIFLDDRDQHWRCIYGRILENDLMHVKWKIVGKASVIAAHWQDTGTVDDPLTPFFFPAKSKPANECMTLTFFIYLFM